MFTTSQCQNPLPWVRPDRDSHGEALVPDGAPDQAKCGDWFVALQPKPIRPKGCGRWADSRLLETIAPTVNVMRVSVCTLLTRLKRRDLVAAAYYPGTGKGLSGNFLAKGRGMAVLCPAESVGTRGPEPSQSDDRSSHEQRTPCSQLVRYSLMNTPPAIALGRAVANLHYQRRTRSWLGHNLHDSA